MQPDILICANDPTLLLTRKLVLQHVGLRVEAVSGLNALIENAAERLLLCSSLNESEQLEAIRLTRTKWPAAKILVGGEDRVLDDRGVLRMSAFAGAEVMIEHARVLMQ